MSELGRLNTPVFAVEGIPPIDISSYRLKVEGLVKQPLEFTLEDLRSMQTSHIDARLTSVSGWSVRTVWDGIRWTDFLKQIPIDDKATHVQIFSVDTYSTSISLKDLSYANNLICYGVRGEPLEEEYGGPLRLVVTNLWGYKSCKWLDRIVFTDRMKGGYWEDRGYTKSGIITFGNTYDVNTQKVRSIKGGGEVTEF